MSFLTVVHGCGVSPVDYCDEEFEITAETPRAAIAAAMGRFRQRWPEVTIEDAFVVPNGVDPNEFCMLDAIR